MVKIMMVVMKNVGLDGDDDDCGMMVAMMILW